MEVSKEQLVEAKRLIAERRYDEAVRVSRRGLLGAPDHVELRLLLGEALLAQEKYDETRVEMLALTRRHPEAASAHRILGEAYLRGGHMDKAKEALRQASVRGDEAAADLLREADGEAFVESHTIERWFGADEPKTLETSLPPIEEEATPPPRKNPMLLPQSIQEPSIQVDPSLAAEASLVLREGELGADTLPGKSADTTQPLPPVVMPATGAHAGLQALLARARQPSEPAPAASKKAIVVPPPTRVSEASRPEIAAKSTPGTISSPGQTAVARPGAWQRNAPPGGASSPGIKRATLQGTPSPIAKAPSLAGIRPVDASKNAAAASAFGAGTRKKQTLLGAPSPLAPSSTHAKAVPFAPAPAAPAPAAPAPSPFPPAAPRTAPAPTVPDEPSEELLRTSELQLTETTDPEQKGAPLLEDEADVTDVLRRDAPGLDVHVIAPGPAAPRAAPPNASVARTFARPGAAPAAPAPAARPQKATLLGVAATPTAAPAHHATQPHPSSAHPASARPSSAPSAAHAPAAPPPAAPPRAAPPPRSAPPPALDDLGSGPLPPTAPEIVAPPVARAAPPRPSVPAPSAPPPPPPHAPASHAPASHAHPPHPTHSTAPPPPPPPRPAPPSAPGGAGAPLPHAGLTGAQTRRLDELPTDPRKQARRSRDETTASRRLQRRNGWAIGAAAVLLVAFLSLGGWLFLRRRAARALADDVERFSDAGLRADVADALDRLEGDDAPEAVALRARLLATRATELGIGDTTDAEVQLGGLDTAGGALLDARIARALVSLARGHADQSATLLSGVEGSGVALAEALHAQALALEALGQLADAHTAATQAAALRPEGPRHAALVARLSLSLGDTAGAARALALAGADRSPSIHLVRARMALAAGDAVTAETEARAVLETLVADASPRDVASAQLVLARASILRGDAAAARAALDAADPLRSPSDEAMALEVAEGYLDAGATDGAARVTSTLPAATLFPARRASVVVRTALASHDLAAADTALAALAPGPAMDFLRAQVRDAQGRADEARAFYESAATDPSLAQAARTREGELLVRIGRSTEARAVLDQALRAAPTDPHVAEIFVRVALAAGDVTGADAALGPALAAHPESGPLRAAHARIALRRGHAAEAMTELSALATASPDDRDVQEALAAAALASGNVAVARSAYEAAIRLEETPEAHLGLAAVLADDAAFDDALQHVARAEALAPASAAAATRLRARVEMLRGAGAASLATVRAAADAAPRDGELWAYRAALEVQAESFSDAETSVARALRGDPNQPEALLVRALLGIEEGDLTGAARAADRAERSATTRGLPPSFAARVAAIRGRLRFEAGDEPDAARLGAQAIELDAHAGLAHLLLADVAIATHEDPVPHLRAAVQGTAAPPEAIGRLAMRLRTGSEACGFAHAYVERAPTGYDRDEVDDVLRHCR